MKRTDEGMWPMNELDERLRALTTPTRALADTQLGELADDRRSPGVTSRLAPMAVAAVVVVLIGVAVVLGRGATPEHVDTLTPVPPATTGGTAPPAVDLVLVPKWGAQASGEQLEVAATVMSRRFKALAIAATVSVEPNAIRITSNTPLAPGVIQLIIAPPGVEMRPVLSGDPDAPVPTGAVAVSTDADPHAPLTFFGANGVEMVLGPVLVGPDAQIFSTVAVVDGSGRTTQRPSFDRTTDVDQFNAALGHCSARDAACPTGRMRVIVDGAVLAAPALVVGRDATGAPGSGSSLDELGSSLPVPLEVR
jgi:hypothetical protein